MDEQVKQDEPDFETMLEVGVYWARMADVSAEISRLLDLLLMINRRRSKVGTVRILRLLEMTVSQAREVHAAFFGGEKNHRRTGNLQPISSLYTPADDDGLMSSGGGQTTFPVSQVPFDTETFANQALQQFTAASRSVTGLKELDRLADALRTAKEAGEDDIARGLRRTMLEILSPTVGAVAESSAPSSPEEVD